MNLSTLQIVTLLQIKSYDIPAIFFIADYVRTHENECIESLQDLIDLTTRLYHQHTSTKVSYTNIDILRVADDIAKQIFKGCKQQGITIQRRGGIC